MVTTLSGITIPAKIHPSHPRIPWTVRDMDRTLQESSVPRMMSSWVSHPMVPYVNCTATNDEDIFGLSCLLTITSHRSFVGNNSVIGSVSCTGMQRKQQRRCDHCSTGTGSKGQDGYHQPVDWGTQRLAGEPGVKGYQSDAKQGDHGHRLTWKREYSRAVQYQLCCRWTWRLISCLVY